jgi:hypothetical protein
MIGSTPSLSPLATSGFSVDVLQETLCKQSTTGGHGGGGGGGGLCGDTGIKGIGRNWESDYVRCVAQQAVQPGMKVVRCMAEAMGLCSHPLDKFAKEMQEVQFHGVKMGSDCQIGKGKKGVQHLPSDYIPPDSLFEAADRLTDAKNMVRDMVLQEKRAELEVENDEAALQYNAELLRRAERDLTIAEMKLAKGSGSLDPDAQKELEQQKADAKRQIELLQADKKQEESKLASDKVHVQKAKDNIQKAEDYKKEAQDKANKEEEKAGKGGAKGDPCPPDTPDCGGNECTGMSQTLLQVLACVEAEAKQEELDELHRQPGWVDPSPDGDGGKWWDRCFGAFEDIHPVNKDCWWKDCGPQNVTSKITAGTCGCGPSINGGAGTHLTSMCGDVDCPDGVLPGVQNNRCTCGGTGGAFGGGMGGPIPKGMFTLSSPRLFSEVRVRDAYTNVERNTTFGGSPLGGGPRP